MADPLWDLSSDYTEAARSAAQSLARGEAEGWEIDLIRRRADAATARAREEGRRAGIEEAARRVELFGGSRTAALMVDVAAAVRALSDESARGSKGKETPRG